jgi:ABC-type polysaccharide/polyol phosphate export permease
LNTVPLYQYDVAINDIVEGLKGWRMWGRLGWQEIKRRYRRTIFGPFWTTLSLGIFIISLGVLWANLWHQDTKTYLPFLCSGMLSWNLVSTIMTEGCGVFTGQEGLIKQLRFPYTFLTCSVVWRNVIVFLHNLAIYVLVAIYSHISVNLYTLLVFPGMLLVCINGIWIATLFGMTCSRYRDIVQVITSLLQITMFVTPIFWAPDQLGPRFQHFVNFNVLYHLVVIIRSPMMGQEPSWVSWVAVLVTTVVGWTITLILLSRFRRRIAYWL